MTTGKNPRRMATESLDTKGLEEGNQANIQSPLSLAKPSSPPRSDFFFRAVTMARPSAATHLHLLCDHDSVSSREDGDELEEEEIVDDQDSVSSKTPKGIALQLHTLEHSWIFLSSSLILSSGLLLFGW
ncbi:hypothetical protein C1H46_015506 [Malus baccata]|uniref:Uncharacterized protein n=1 Tax=Malus baccata TaxID=106549 RepID=A0A540MJ97_MALBA|nr:hypothetical protein C1H46_015506 [Malus baccata]